MQFQRDLDILLSRIETEYLNGNGLPYLHRDISKYTVQRAIQMQFIELGGAEGYPVLLFTSNGYEKWMQRKRRIPRQKRECTERVFVTA